MGGGYSCCRFPRCFFSLKPPERRDDEGDDGGGEYGQETRCGSRKVRPSDEDRGRWVGEPDVDGKATAFIAKFHEARLMDLESQHATAGGGRFVD